MQKPDNIATKDWVLSLTSEELQLSQVIVETVISDAYKEASKAVKQHNQVELSGFGKLLVSQAKVRRKKGRVEKFLNGIEQLLISEQDEEKKQKLQKKKEQLVDTIEELYRKQQR